LEKRCDVASRVAVVDEAKRETPSEEGDCALAKGKRKQ